MVKKGSGIKYKKIFAGILCGFMCFIFVLCGAVYHFFYDINAIKPGTEIAQSISPSGDYTITVYLNDGGATTGYAVLCVLNDGRKTKNVYWNYPCGSADIEWLSDDIVSINKQILDISKKEIFDYRRG